MCGAGGHAAPGARWLRQISRASPADGDCDLEGGGGGGEDA
eukprot:CAMPEP_0180181174 /NCGR_PEP_ID=MMETSP0986-20121125/39985_1 /TAXON_ID=697907 /ORGANISM="non described non described, Strain CCMP2293" /LENGTH=40 /DNA_ID= /DNA_START= /DNA_END= /DNA_ORIENTATION=